MLGIDYGSHRVGVAVGDTEIGLASPLTTIDVDGDFGKVFPKIDALAKAEECEKIVVGLPVKLDGSESASTRNARKFAEKLQKATTIDVVLWDERLTTVEANRALMTAEHSGRERRARIDRAAAAVLLQSYLDANTEPRWTDPDELDMHEVSAPPKSAGRDRAKRRS